MRLWHSLTLIALLLAGLSWSRAQTPSVHSQTLYVFGTLVEIIIHSRDEQAATAATHDIAQLFQQLHRDWHAWEPGALQDVNQALAQGKPAPLTARLSDLVQLGQHLSCTSGGSFDPGIGGLVALWGFHADTPPLGVIPSTQEIAAWQGAGIADLQIRDGQAHAHDPRVQLDLGGYAKGAALDLAGQILIAHGLPDAILNAGGDVNVLGRHGHRPWRVAIRDPFVWGAVASISLSPGEVLYTSGNYERFFDSQGQRFSHLLDPRTGRPVQGIVSASVLGRNGARADAAATALAVAGARDWTTTAARMGATAALLITDDGTVLATPEMARRLDPGPTAHPVTVVPLPEADTPACPGDVGFPTLAQAITANR